MSEKKVCADCNIGVGLNMIFRVCKAAQKACEDIEEKVDNQKITVQDAIDQVVQRLDGDQQSIEIVEEIEDAMMKNLEKSAGKCVSIIVKQDMNTSIQSMIDNREDALKKAEPDSDFAKNAKILLNNLKKSQDLINDLPVCEGNE